MWCESMLLACFLTAMPPSEYDYEPHEFYTIASVSSELDKTVCRSNYWGCAIPRRRLVVINKALVGEWRDIILRHEKAHLNGWIHEVRPRVRQ
jgi:hypothetical protein